MKQLVEVIAKSLVDHPEAVQVDEKQENQQTRNGNEERSWKWYH